MKAMKKITAVLAALLLMCSSALSVSAAETYLLIDGFYFDVNNDGNAVIHKYDDRSLDVQIPDQLLSYPVSEIGNYAFFNHAAISSVDFSQATGLKRIGDNAFYGCTGLKEVTLCATLEELGFGAFQSCTALESLVIENGLQEIPGQAFYGCGALSEIALPESVTTIGERAFENCAGLVKIGIPASVESIADNAFKGCDDLCIYCTKDSYALSYAVENDIRYVITDPDPVTFLLGDADGDGSVTILDATTVQRLLAGLITDEDGMIELRSDILGDGLDILDATKIQRFLAEYETPEPIGETVSRIPTVKG